MNRFFTLIALTLALLTASAARAQSLDLSWNTIDCGGGFSSRGAFTLSGSIGQPDAAGSMLSGGAFTLFGGFWADTAVPRPCPADFDGDGFITGLDFDAYAAAFEEGDISSDFDNDGFVTGVDFDAYVLAFEEGC